MNLKRLATSLLVCPWLVAATPGVGSCDPDSTDTPRSCFRAQGCPNCDWIVLLEFGMGLDLAPGVILSGDDENDRYPSFSGQVALDLGGLVAPFYQLDVLRSPSRTYRDSFVGLKLESYAAPLGVLLMGLLAAATRE